MISQNSKNYFEVIQFKYIFMSHKKKRMNDTDGTNIWK